MIKGDTPMATTGSSTLGLSRRYLRRIFSLVRLPVRKASTQMADTAWAMMVASAAPWTPIFMPKIKMGSSTMFVTAPMITVSMEVVEKPWVVIKLFRAREIWTNTVPQR